MKSTRSKPARKPRKRQDLKRVAPEFSRWRRVLVIEDDRLRLMSQRERMRTSNGPVVAAIQWVERHADGFDRLALLIDAADYMNERRDVDPKAANHVAVSFTMLRDELRMLRKRLWV
jgi:hypothetical protein